MFRRNVIATCGLGVAVMCAVLACRSAYCDEPAAGSGAKSGPAGAVRKAPVSRADSIRRWQKMRFGLFIHWGPGSLTGKELSWARKRKEVPAAEYDNLYKKFNPTKFDADEWVRIAKSAGTKYMVFTTKHHDGFVNFDSKVTDYKITSPKCPFRRDVTKELADACRKGRIMLGFYYSQRDWHSPHFMTGSHHVLIKEIHKQIEELCTNYGKVGVFWFDATAFGARHWDSRNLFKIIRKHQPGAIINDRCGLPADFKTVEYRVGGFNRRQPWETCMQLGTQWSWKPDDKIKSLKQCVHNLVRCAGGDGNLLLNVGPMPDGRIEPRQVKRLEEIGKWLEKYGRSIYGTRGGPFKPVKWGAATCKDRQIYLHILDWPAERVTLPPINRKIVASSVLTGGKAAVVQNDKQITVAVPPAARDAIDTIVVLTLDGSALDISAPR